MRIFFDSSAFVKRYIKEPGWPQVVSYSEKAAALALSILTPVELHSALCRKLREKTITIAQYELAEDTLKKEIQDVDMIHLTPAICNTAMDLLKRIYLRSLDAIQVASAIHWKSELFISSDKRQLQAARKMGLKVKTI